MESMKESAANVAASAKSGMEKTQATVQEKVERMTAHNPAVKEMATEKKERRIAQAELEKQEAREHNAKTKEASQAGVGPHPGYRAAGTGTGTATYSTTGAPGHPTGAHQMSALQGHRTGRPAGQVVEGVAGAHPVDPRTATYSTTGAPGHLTGAHQTSALPGHGTGRPAGQVVEGIAGAHPVGINTGTQRTSAAHNTHTGGGAGAQGYGTTGGYTS